MKSRTTIQFRRSFANLPEQVQEQTRGAYRQFKENSNHPSLRFKKVHPELPIYPARISKASDWKRSVPLLPITRPDATPQHSFLNEPTKISVQPLQRSRLFHS